jgi:RNA polymerase II-associated factor 1
MIAAILARPGAQVTHPADKALLKPLSALSKPIAAHTVSFLRRTEYTATQNIQHFSSSTAKDLNRAREDVRRRRQDENKEDPINIMRNIIKGFDIAYPKDAYKGEDNTTNLRGAQPTADDLKGWAKPVHPTNPRLKLLESYPVLPDLDAIPTTGFYVVMKLSTNPLISGAKNDERLNAAILRPVNDAKAESEYQQKLAEWNPDSTNPEPIREYDYDYFIPAEESSVPGIKRKFDVNDHENEDPELYTADLGDGLRAFKYSRVRTYETQNQHGDAQNFYNDSVALALHDPEEAGNANPGAKRRLQKGAYIYPIVQRTSLRPKRGNPRMLASGEDQKVDELNVTITEMDEASRASQQERRAALDPNAGPVAAAG